MNILSFPKCQILKAPYNRETSFDTHSKLTAGGYTRNESGKPFYS